MDSKMLSKLELIEDNTERLRQIEQLLEKLVESNQRAEKHLEQMLRMYQQSAQPESRGGVSLL